MFKPIKSEVEYIESCSQLEKLLSGSSSISDEVELLSIIIRDYEQKNIHITAPDPIDALLFRMEQKNLAPRDLTPYIGSRSKVSEVLSRTRSLTLPMIRALHEGLGIPASVLIQEPSGQVDEDVEPDWNQFPRKEMVARGWISDSLDEIQKFFNFLPINLRSAVLYRKSKQVRSARKLDYHEIAAWISRVCHLGSTQELPTKFDPNKLKKENLTELVQLSKFEDGPLKAQLFLRDLGIPLVFEPNLAHTYLDGAAVLAYPDRPIIALTLRYDRVDSFWFTLLHEIAHIVLHSKKDVNEFIDDLDLDPKGDTLEQEADDFAGEILIPSSEWKKSPASRLRSPEAVFHLANKLSISPAIVAGRMRHEWKAYRLFSNLVGHNQVRILFPHINWND